MTYQEALNKINNMTDVEKDALEALVLTSDKDDHGQIMEFLMLELDAETQIPTDSIYWIDVCQNTLPDGTYQTGDKISFDINGKERFYQILECNAFQTNPTP